MQEPVLIINKGVDELQRRVVQQGRHRDIVGMADPPFGVNSRGDISVGGPASVLQ